MLRLLSACQKLCRSDPWHVQGTSQTLQADNQRPDSHGSNRSHTALSMLRWQAVVDAHNKLKVCLSNNCVCGVVVKRCDVEPSVVLLQTGEVWADSAARAGTQC